jgi:ERF superfamily protein
MHRSSESIASLAAALAKAQAELTNPEKTQIATVELGESGAAGRSFRYAPLSSGLEIVRKTLGQHAIAVIQTTAIDSATDTVNLTTVLAHSSGEWISSDWPVCSVADRTTPHRMGAALTYARRYALFTLVGIAGEDDVDAPDLDTPAPPPRSERMDNSNSKIKGGNGASHHSKPLHRGSGVATKGAPRAVLNADQSRALRDRLLTEVAGLQSADAATAWAHANISAKNGLTTSDADDVERAFQARLDACERAEAQTGADARASKALSKVIGNAGSRSTHKKQRTERVDKSSLAISEPRRVRDRVHVKYVATHPCLICGRSPVDAHHIRFAQRSALGRRVSDEFTVPLCRGHHRSLHRAGDEAKWWRTAGIDPMTSARDLWVETLVARGQLALDDSSRPTMPGANLGAAKLPEAPSAR